MSSVHGSKIRHHNKSSFHGTCALGKIRKLIHITFHNDELQPYIRIFPRHLCTQHIQVPDIFLHQQKVSTRADIRV